MKIETQLLKPNTIKPEERYQMKFLNKLLVLLAMSFASHLANATNCGVGTTFQRGSDGVARCVAAVPLADLKPSQTQGQAVGVGVGVSTSLAVGVSNGLANDVSVSANSPVVQESNQSSMYVLPAPAQAAALPAGFCTDGRSSQLSILGIGYGSSRSSFDTINYKRCIEVAKAMRQQSPQELAMAHCASSVDVPNCVAQLIAALTPPAFNLVAEPVSKPEAIAATEQSTCKATDAISARYKAKKTRKPAKNLCQ
jgi:hypothetical protein